MYTITITDLIDNEITDICVVDSEEAVEAVMLALAATLPKYLDVNFYEGVSV